MPNDWLPTATFGFPNCTRLNRLNTSVRNWRFTRSVIAVSLKQREIVVSDAGSPQLRVGAAFASKSERRGLRETRLVEPAADSVLSRAVNKLVTTRYDVRARAAAEGVCQIYAGGESKRIAFLKS